MKRALFLLPALIALSPAHAEPRNPLDAVRLEDLSATRDRPLFTPTRRRPPPIRVDAPPPEPPPAEKAVAIGPPPFDLIGAVVGQGAAYALLRNKSTNQVVRLRPGDDAEGWRIGVIGVRSVALERDGRKESLALATPPTAPSGAELAGDPAPDEAVATPPPAAARVHRRADP